MEQLPGGDAIFLALETPNAPGHVGGLTVLDPSESPDFSFEHVRREAIHVRVDRHGSQAHLTARSDNPNGNLAAIGHEHGVEHGRPLWVVGSETGPRGPGVGRCE